MTMLARFKQTKAQLSNLDDRMLRDIGMIREDIPAVSDAKNTESVDRGFVSGSYYVMPAGFGISLTR